jgi:hypothetical protein
MRQEGEETKWIFSSCTRDDEHYVTPASETDWAVRCYENNAAANSWGLKGWRSSEDSPTPT